jgi:hypothetical protein
VILSTAFVHLLQETIDNLSNERVSKAWRNDWQRLASDLGIMKYVVKALKALTDTRSVFGIVFS